MSARSPVDAAGHQALDAYSRAVTSVVQTVLPSVASLAAYAPVRGGRRVAGQGSAVAITNDGFLLTSAHVVARASHAVASFVDGREVDVEVVGTDPLSDLALLRARADLIAVELGDASRLLVGQLVVAVGNPLGFSGSVTAGIVSGLGRSFPTRAGSVVRFVENVIQTDAALHPGNSGGALADASGQVVGINTALVGPAVGQGLGLAIPINDATRRIVSALMSEGRVRRAYLGIAGGPRPLPPRLAEKLGRDRAVEVVEVVEASPAARAGLRSEDIVVALNGEVVASMADVQRIMDSSTIGRPIRVDVYRNGQELKFDLVAEEMRA